MAKEIVSKFGKLFLLQHQTQELGRNDRPESHSGGVIPLANLYLISII